MSSRSRSCSRQSRLPLPKISLTRSKSNLGQVIAAKGSCVRSTARSHSTLGTPASRSRSRSLTFVKASGSKNLPPSFIKVKQYFQMKNPKLIALQPPTVANFIETMNILFKDLGLLNITFTLANYLELVPKYLIILNYATKVSPKFMKTVNSSVGFPQVLEIWTFLHDMVEVSQQNCYFPNVSENDINMFQLCLNTDCKTYVLQNKGEDGETSKQLEEEFTKNLYKLMDVDIDYMNNLKTTTKTYTKNIKEQKVVEEQLIKSLEQKTENHNVMVNAQKKIKELTQEKHQVEQILASQKHTKTDYEELVLKKQIMEQRHELKKSREEKMQTLLDKNHAKCNKYRLEMAKMSYTFNTALYDHIEVMPEIEECKVRESGFRNPEVLNELNAVNEKLIHLNEELLLSIDMKNEHLALVCDNIEEGKKELKQLKKDQTDNYHERAQLQQELFQNAKNYKAKLSETKAILESLTQKQADVLAERIDISEEEQYQRVANERLNASILFKSQLQQRIKDYKKKFDPNIILCLARLQNEAAVFKKKYVKFETDRSAIYAEYIKKTKEQMREYDDCRKEYERILNKHM